MKLQVELSEIICHVIGFLLIHYLDPKQAFLGLVCKLCLATSKLQNSKPLPQSKKFKETRQRNGLIKILSNTTVFNKKRK